MENENDKFGYDAMKEIIDKNRTKKDLEKRLEDQKEDEEFEEKYKMIFLDEPLPVETKEIPKDKKLEAFKKFLIAAGVALTLTAGTIEVVDLANHPESYMPTDPNYSGPPTISELLERTPENFGIGGR